MFGFGKKKNIDQKGKKPSKAVVKPFSYHPKVILAWVKSLEGDEKFTHYLTNNNFAELVMVQHALNLNDNAREWLMENGYAHVMAMINAAEGNAQALRWLKVNGFDLFYHMALAIDGEPEGFKWINQHSTPDIFLLTKTMKDIKDKIEEENNDIHLRSTR
ncbi:MAG: hypothetical protein JJT77_04190 [Crocinitomicaceae bacterium]|nr:hypothetical protein [Crocinitomicaceae bacterium]